MSFYLAIVGTNDFPVFELDLSQRDVKVIPLHSNIIRY